MRFIIRYFHHELILIVRAFLVLFIFPVDYYMEFISAVFLRYIMISRSGLGMIQEPYL